jgi:signal transduction histidine kinase
MAEKKTRFHSLRWRLTSPLFLAVLVVAMVGAYILARNLAVGVDDYQQNVLIQSSRSVAQRTAQHYDFQRQEAQRVAFTIGVAEAVQNPQPETLQPILESLARVNGMDNIIVTGPNGREILGVQALDGQFALSTDTDLSQQPIVRSVVDDAFVGATGLMRSPQGVVLYTGVPIQLGDQFIGIALVGQQLDTVLADLQGSATSDLVLYGADGLLLETTLTGLDDWSQLDLSQPIFTQAAMADQAIPLVTLQIGDDAFQGAYQPFIFGPNRLGVVGSLVRDNVPYVTLFGRQLTALLAAALAGVAVLVTFVGANRVAMRAQRVRSVAEKLAAGEAQARTKMHPADEIRAVGHALDEYADYVQVKQDDLQRSLRRKRREINHMMRVFTAMPDGVVVQDMDGRVLMMNDRAREVLGSQRMFRSTHLDALADAVAEKLGPALSPGLYTLGNPHRISIDERMVSAQAAAIVATGSGRRLGTVVMLRDITDTVRQERERELMLQRLTRDIQQPLADLARTGRRVHSDMVNAFAREITRHSVALQRMIIDMQEIANVDALSVRQKQRPLYLETLVWNVANEWRQVARSSDLTLHVIIERKGLFILGDERRLRWAIGNVIDNSIKYTLPGGALTLEIKDEEDGMAVLRVRDNGVGISRQDRLNLFTRYYRGVPVQPDGQPLRVPGMGQGLHISRQIFQAHGGSIQVKSSVGVGTAVYLRLPLTAPVGMTLPQFEADMDGETVRLPEDILIERD